MGGALGVSKQQQLRGEPMNKYFSAVHVHTADGVEHDVTEAYRAGKPGWTQPGVAGNQDELEPHRSLPTTPAPAPSADEVRENLVQQYLETVRRQQELVARLAEVGIRAEEVAVGGVR